MVEKIRSQVAPSEASSKQERTASDIEEDDATAEFDMFQEPESFRPSTPPSTRVEWTLRVPFLPSEDQDEGQEEEEEEEEASVVIALELVGRSPLWGHILWPASQHLSSYLATQPLARRRWIEGKIVLELGAAAGVPSVVAAILGAGYVCATDYPDPDLVRTLEGNVGVWSRRVVPELSPKRGRGRAGEECVTCLVETLGYRWGDDVDELLAHLRRALSSTSASASTPTPAAPSEPAYFDTVILSDLIFNHQAHDALLTTCERTTYTPAGWEARWAAERARVLDEERERKGAVGHKDEDGDAVYASMREAGEAVVSMEDVVQRQDQDEASPARSTVLVSFTHHRPALAHRDLSFFARARRLGWQCARVASAPCEPVFKDDVGDVAKRSTVHVWAMWRA